MSRGYKCLSGAHKKEERELYQNENDKVVNDMKIMTMRNMKMKMKLSIQRMLQSDEQHIH